MKKIEIAVYSIDELKTLNKIIEGLNNEKK